MVSVKKVEKALKRQGISTKIDKANISLGIPKHFPQINPLNRKKICQDR